MLRRDRGCGVRLLQQVLEIHGLVTVFFGLSTIESLRNGTPMTLCVKLKEIQRTRDWKNDGIFDGIF
jgi:hypothetical protein